MTGPEMEGLVDKLADKLNVAVDNVMPVAQEALDQFVARETYLATVSGILVVVGAILLSITVFFTYKSIKNLEEASCSEEPRHVFTIICSIVGGIIGIVLVCSQTHCMIYHAAKAVAPLAALVGI